MQHFLSTADWSQEQLNGLLKLAADLKQDPVQDRLRGKSIALMFLNPSMRTRTSFDLGMQQLGGIAIVLQPGKDAWGVEFNAGAVMEGDAEEHIAEVAGVLSRYCDLIGLRAFPPFRDWSVEREDPVIRALAKHATVPVINMETIVHPCQELALMMTLKEYFGTVQQPEVCVDLDLASTSLEHGGRQFGVVDCKQVWHGCHLAVPGGGVSPRFTIRVRGVTIC